MIIEILVLLGMLTGGSALVRAVGIHGWALPGLGFITGVALTAIIGTFQIVTPLPTWPILTIVLATFAPILFWAVRLYQGYDVRIRIFPALITGLFVAFTTFILWQIHLVNWHTDTFFNIESAALISQGQFEEARFAGLTKRLTAIPVIHSLASLSGEYYLRAFAPLLSLSTIVSLLWVFVKGTARKVKTVPALLYGAGAVLLLVTNSRYIFNSFYVNGHLLFAALLIIIVGAAWLLASRTNLPRSGLVAIQTVAASALVFVRPEAAIFAGLALLPMLVSKHIQFKHKAIPLAALGISTIAWQAFVLSRYIDAGSSIPDDVYAMLVYGAILLVAIPFLKLRLIQNYSQYVLGIAEIGLWVSLVFFTISDPLNLTKSLNAMFYNFVMGSGSWGWSLIMLAALFGVVLLFKRFSQQVYIRFAITTFLPMSLILGYLRGGGYRVGDGDSFNRMMIHIVPVTVLFIVLAAALGENRIKKKNNNS